MGKAKTSKAPQMIIEDVPIDSVMLDAANVRTHNERNMAAIVGSLQQFGQQKPIVVDSKGIIPQGCVVGLSKLPKLVQCFARRLQIQERMTQQIANAIMDELQPIGAACVVKARHLCMLIRGVRCDAFMTTSCMLGVFRDPVSGARQEFLSLVNSDGG